MSSYEVRVPDRIEGLLSSLAGKTQAAHWDYTGSERDVPGAVKMLRAAIGDAALVIGLLMETPEWKAATAPELHRAVEVTLTIEAVEGQ